MNLGDRDKPLVFLNLLHRRKARASTCLFVAMFALFCLLSKVHALPLATDYGPPSDLNPHPLPALPTLGPAGYIFTEPTFGYRILRVTDENTMPGNRSFVLKYPTIMFNCDSTKLYVHDPELVKPEKEPVRSPQ